jgi:dTDP-4-amino-4,6-dideoxygalactose transaminase
MSSIPFTRPSLSGLEERYVLEALRSGRLAGDGPFTKRCHAELERRTGAAKALLTHSCTAALEMAALLAEIGPGDEVIMPSYTFVSTANAFVLRGATAVFVDARPDTLNLDEALVADAIGPRTRAIVAVHYAGVACEMDRLLALAAAHQLLVIEDAAQGYGSRYRDRPLGTIGDLGALSFHETKNVVSGEGGALLLRDERLVSRAEIIREKGTNRSAFFRGQVDKYTWADLGSSYLPGELVAAFLLGQLEQAETLNAARHALWGRYHEAFAEAEAQGRCRRPIVPPHCEHNAHMYYLLLPSLADRQALIEHLRLRGITAPFHYVPLHSAPAGRRFGRAHEALPVTDRISDTLIRLPLFGDLGTEVDVVIDATLEFLREVPAPGTR